MTQAARTFDTLLVGGGVMGLSIAWELAQRGGNVCVVDAQEMGREASWAAAGMLPPGPCKDALPQCSAYDQLAGLSEELHPAWHRQLLELTTIDNGYRPTGAIYLAGQGSLEPHIEQWQRFGTEYVELDGAALADLEPTLSTQTPAVLVPGEGQLRPPRHMKALAAACVRAGVTLIPGCQVLGWNRTATAITAAITSTGEIAAGNYCLTSGSWTGVVAATLGFEIPVRPVRGQIMLLKGPAGTPTRIVNSGPRYLTPRPDGRVLVGATQEEVGFDKRTTVAGLAELASFARQTCPALANFTVEKTWSGFRPGTADDLPYLGRLPGIDNAWIAAGHFRAGIQLSPATAVVMRSLILGETPPVNVDELSLARL